MKKVSPCFCFSKQRLVAMQCWAEAALKMAESVSSWPLIEILYPRCNPRQIELYTKSSRLQFYQVDEVVLVQKVS